MLSDKNKNDEFDDSKLDEYLDASEIKPEDSNYALPVRIVWVDDVPICSLSGFSASTGKPKSKKSFNVSVMVAAALKNSQILNYKVRLPENKRKILYIDTEQTQGECHIVLSRIIKLAGLENNKNLSIINFFGLRSYNQEMRVALIDRALRRCNEYGLVIIDGIRDLLYDINNVNESVGLINKLMRWSGEYNLHIHCVLHLNKGDDNIRGHIGTEVNNKAETVMLVRKSATVPDISTVESMHVRNREFTPFAFMIDENGLPKLAENYSISSGVSKITKNVATNLTAEQHMDALSVAFGDNSKIVGYNKLIQELMRGYSSIGITRGKTTINKILTQLLSMKIIVKEDGQSYRLQCEEFDNTDQ
jgi:hypothetical protein